MKKLILGPVAALVMSGGLVALGSSAPASAACGNPQYPACFDTVTKTTVQKTSRTGRIITVTVDARGTNAVPKGTLECEFQKPNGGNLTIVRVVRQGQATIARDFRQPGEWVFQCEFLPAPGSIFDNARTQQKDFLVKRA